MTRHEIRVLYLVAKAEPANCRHSTISQAMARIKREERELAIEHLEAMDLISSAKQPNPTGQRGGSGGLVYWLLEGGREAVAHLIERGEMQNPYSGA